MFDTKIAVVIRDDLATWLVQPLIVLSAGRDLIKTIYSRGFHQRFSYE
jgi:hypothetical protein